MKKVILFCFLLPGCTPENTIPATPAGPAVFDQATSTLIKMGAFTGIGGHSTNGKVSVYDSNGKKFVLLDPFMSQNGPDLKVYLSKDISASSYVRLGNLKSINGSQSYEVPGMPDIAQYTYVHIWCEKFSVEFARAELN
jgi:hypothetical protein